MAINHTLFTGQTELAGDVHSTHAVDGVKQLPVHSGKKFIRLRSHRNRNVNKNRGVKEP